MSIRSNLGPNRWGCILAKQFRAKRPMKSVSSHLVPTVRARGQTAPVIRAGVLAKRRNELICFFFQRNQRSPPAGPAGAILAEPNPPVASPAIWRNKPTRGRLRHLAEQTHGWSARNLAKQTQSSSTAGARTFPHSSRPVPPIFTKHKTTKRTLLRKSSKIKDVVVSVLSPARHRGRDGVERGFAPWRRRGRRPGPCRGGRRRLCRRALRRRGARGRPR